MLLLTCSILAFVARIWIFKYCWAHVWTGLELWMQRCGKRACLHWHARTVHGNASKCFTYALREADDASVLFGRASIYWKNGFSEKQCVFIFCFSFILRSSWINKLCISLLFNTTVVYFYKKSCEISYTKHDLWSIVKSKHVEIMVRSIVTWMEPRWLA
jgi:hypothetical protein